jgi:hypothetical protein
MSIAPKPLTDLESQLGGHSNCCLLLVDFAYSYVVLSSGALKPFMAFQVALGWRRGVVLDFCE